MPRQLVIHENMDVIVEVTKTLKRALGTEASIVREVNFKFAMEQIESTDLSWSLIVLSSSAPAGDSTSASALGCAAACDFIRWVRVLRKQNIPLIVLSPVLDPVIIQVLKMWEDSTAVVLYQWMDLEQRARELHRSLPMDSTLELEITMQEGDSGLWRVQRNGPLGTHRMGRLTINPRQFEDLINLSKSVPRAGAHWRDSLNSVAGQLDRVLFDDGNEEFMRVYYDERARVGGSEKVRIFFTMANSRQPAMVEALRDRTVNPPFTMLKAPIVRQYGSAGSRRPIFVDDVSRRGPINCLIINAHPTAGVFDDGTWKGEAEALPEVREEARSIHAVLVAAREAGVGVERVDWLDISTVSNEIIETVFEKLTSHPWHIVHFAGHALLNENNLPALLLKAAPKPPDNQPAQVPDAGPKGTVLSFERLAEKLRQTQFVFVSSCKSADQAFITRAVDHVIPAILGYSWRVGDSAASQFAESFYQALFAKGKNSFKSLEYAFVAARVAAWTRNSDDNTWASPLLLTQLRYTKPD